MASQQIKIDVRMDFLGRNISLGTGLEIISVMCIEEIIRNNIQISKNQVITYLTTQKNYYAANETEFLNKFLIDYSIGCYCEVKKSGISNAIKEVAADLPVPCEIFGYLNSQLWKTLVSVYIDRIFKKSKSAIKMKISSKTYLKFRKDETLDIEDDIEVFCDILSAWFAYEQISGVRLCIEDEEGGDPFIMVEIKP